MCIQIIKKSVCCVVSLVVFVYHYFISTGVNICLKKIWNCLSVILGYFETVFSDASEYYQPQTYVLLDLYSIHPTCWGWMQFKVYNWRFCSQGQNYILYRYTCIQPQQVEALHHPRSPLDGEIYPRHLCTLYRYEVWQIYYHG